MDGKESDSLGSGIYDRHRAKGLPGSGTAGFPAWPEAKAGEPGQPEPVRDNPDLAGPRGADRLGTRPGIAESARRFLGTGLLGRPPTRRFSLQSFPLTALQNSTFSLRFNRLRTYC